MSAGTGAQLVCCLGLCSDGLTDVEFLRHIANTIKVSGAVRSEVSAYRSLNMTNSVSLLSMTDVALHEAKAQLSALVDRVSNGGGDVVITRRGKPVARLVPIDDESAIESALAHLLAARQSSTPGPQSLRELIDEGRR